MGPIMSRNARPAPARAVDKSSGLDRRSLLKAAAISAAMVTPGAVVAQAAETTPAPPTPAATQPPAAAVAGAGGLSQAGIARLHEAMARHVESGRLPGLVTLVSRRDEVHVDTIGVQSFG